MSGEISGIIKKNKGFMYFIAPPAGMYCQPLVHPCVCPHPFLGCTPVFVQCLVSRAQSLQAIPTGTPGYPVLPGSRFSGAQALAQWWLHPAVRVPALRCAQVGSHMCLLQLLFSSELFVQERERENPNNLCVIWEFEVFS